MPIYTYQCSNCGVRFDQEQSFDEQNPVRCPECGKNALHRVYRPVGVVFKGSGFYSTDNRSSTRSSTTQTDTKDKDKDKDKSKSETKAPATAPASETAPKAND